MSAFLVPENCSRCTDKGKLLYFVLPNEAKRRGKKVIFKYPSSVWLCRDCRESLNRWVTMEQKGMKNLRDDMLNLLVSGKVLLRTRFGNLWWLKK